MLASLALSLLVFADDGTYKLEIESSPGIRFEGICVSTDPVEEKKIEGTSSGEYQLNAQIHKCTFKKVDAPINIRVYQNRQLIYSKASKTPPTAGIEFVIPLGKKKK